MHIFEKNFKAKATGKYNMAIINTIGKACKLQNGKTYNSFEELLGDFEGKPVLVFVKNDENVYNGKTYNNLYVKMWNQTKFTNVQHQFKCKYLGGDTMYIASDILYAKLSINDILSLI